MNTLPAYALLGRVDTPADLRQLPSADLPALASEMRRYLIETLGRIGGHFAANLGTVELTIALHKCFDTPHDRLVWDVGHQAYPHKMLTERRSRLESIRRLGGLHPFPARNESHYDTFGVGHSSTAISAAIGMALGAKVQGKKRRSVAIIGDGGFTGGMAMEALNHAGDVGADVLIVFNDNDMSISESVGALSKTTRRGKLQGLVEAFACTYHGPIDGHDLPTLIRTFETLKDASGPQFLHVLTQKGKGFVPAENQPITYHGVTQFDPVTGAFPAKKPSKPTYTDIFSAWICEAAAADTSVVAITPAMREGSGLVAFQKAFPERYHDVAIAEQHATTLAAGLACEGAKPVLAIYSSFLQRGYDQLIHDIALQNLPVLLAVDRGGLVGADGATHHGAFDLSFLRCIPNMVVMAPSDALECRRMLQTGLGLKQPSAVRYPRGSGVDISADLLAESAKPLTVGKGRIVREALGRRRPRVAFLAFGCMVEGALQAADILDAVVADMRFVKPLDVELILDLANENDLLVTLEDNAKQGGAGSAVSEVLAAHHVNVPVLHLGLPDHFIEHGTREELFAQIGLDASGILRSVQKRLRAKDLDEAERKVG
jgi:1-deoxy-D-xylulose-5-phosphate synthase